MLDAKKEQRKRMFFMAEEGRSRRKKTITMLKGREFKESFTVYLSPAGVKDKLTSLDVQVGHIHRWPLPIRACRLRFFGKYSRSSKPCFGSR